MQSASLHLLSAGLLCLLAAVHATLTEADEAEFRRVPWLDWRQAMDAYKTEYRAADLLGKNSQENPNQLKFYPDNRVLEGRTVVLFCLLTPDKFNGYRTNSISLQLLQEAFTHRRSLLAPTRRLMSHADQLNCWNYAQESVCQPLRDCNQPSQTSLRTVGIITKEGWGVFQLTAGKLTHAHFQCISEMQSVLTSEERTEKKLREYVTVGSDVEQLQVFRHSIGNPVLQLNQAGFPRGQPLTAQCQVANSMPGSEFSIDLVLLRPPPAGTPGAARRELLATAATTAAEPLGKLDWRGEAALLSHHGLTVLCLLRDDWGDQKGQRAASGLLLVRYMFPVYLDNPRVRNEMAPVRLKSSQINYYKSPKMIKLRQAEYVVCKLDAFPLPSVQWQASTGKAVWIFNDTLFITKSTRAGQKLTAQCSASHQDLGLSDTLEVEIQILSMAPQSLAASSGLSGGLLLLVSLIFCFPA